MVDDALASVVARDQQQAVNACQRGAQGLRAGIIGHAHLHTARGEVIGLASGAHDGDDAGRGYAAGKKLLNRKTSKVA
jgi:hypothetical protein